MTWSSTKPTAHERELERERDEIARQLDEVRRQQEREAGERREEQKQRIRDRQPSNRLYHGEITNPREAIQTHIACLILERADQARFEAEFQSESIREFGECTIKPGQWAGWITEAQQLLKEYDETVGRAERELAERWMQAPEGSTRRVAGEALRDGDWSRLAI